MAPAALIPFCEFGGSQSAMGDKIDQFDVPVCNSFKAKIIMIMIIQKIFSSQ